MHFAQRHGEKIRRNTEYLLFAVLPRFNSVAPCEMRNVLLLKPIDKNQSITYSTGYIFTSLSGMILNNVTGYNRVI